MTFNIQSGKNYPIDVQKIDLNYCAKVIEKYDPDIVGLNEINGDGVWGNQPKELAEMLGYPYYYFAKAIELDNRDYGNAILSKYPLLSVETLIVPDPEVKDEDTYYETRCILKADINVCGGIRVYVTHFGLARGEQKNSVELLKTLLGSNPEKTVLMGDFNVKPEDEMLTEIRNRLTDTAPDMSDKYYTWPSDAPERKIDYIFVSGDAVISGTQVIPEIGSDHNAYMSNIEFDE